jgi:lipopolysaccharide transport system ATP-binding protein
MNAEEFRVVPLGDRARQRWSPSGRIPRDCAVDISNASVSFPISPFVRRSVKVKLMELMGHKGEHTIDGQFVSALAGVTLQFQKGERVGIIGANGSGKSTLLRAIAGIYPLCEGSISVRGQIGTLLDVSLGFEAESTGRENIYYRGMSMGISPRRLRAVEDDIIAFANLGSFIDLPMRTYSAGMWVRLGFAVSTHFSPDVMLIDEVFGAGDAAFAKRAMVRMMHVVNNSGIVVLVTHDIQLIRDVCKRVIWMRNGRVERDGSTSVVIQAYEDSIIGRTQA